MEHRRWRRPHRATGRRIRRFRPGVLILSLSRSFSQLVRGQVVIKKSLAITLPNILLYLLQYLDLDANNNKFVWRRLCYVIVPRKLLSNSVIIILFRCSLCINHMQHHPKTSVWVGKKRIEFQHLGFVSS